MKLKNNPNVIRLDYTRVIQPNTLAKHLHFSDMQFAFSP